MKWLFTLVTLLLIATACGNKIPEPENNSNKKDFLDNQTASAASLRPNGDEDFEVRYYSRGNSLYVDCFLKDFAFSSKAKKQRAQVRFYLDGKKINDYKTAAFIVKGIPEGQHHIKLEILHENGKPAGLGKNFTVNIDSAI